MPVTIQGSSETSASQHAGVYGGEERRMGADRRRAIGRDERATTATLTGGSSLELLGGAVAVVLAIIGLSGFMPLHMASIATIAIGAGLLAHGASVAARWADAARLAAADRIERVEVAGSAGSEVLGGATGVVLGILALAGVMPFMLLASAAIVFGGTILLSAPGHPDLARLATDRDRQIGRITRDAIEATTGAMVLAGIGAIVLGILAVIRVGPALELAMVAMLAVGGALLLTGGALTARFARRLQQAT